MHTKECENANADILITGMSCAACISSLENHLSSLNGVNKAVVNLITNKANCEINLKHISVDEICNEIKSLGFDAHLQKLTLLDVSYGRIDKETTTTSLETLTSKSTAASEFPEKAASNKLSASLSFKVNSKAKRRLYFGNSHKGEIVECVKKVQKTVGVHSCCYIAKSESILICYDPYTIGARTIQSLVADSLNFHTVTLIVYNYTEQSLKEQFESIVNKLKFCIVPTIFVAAMAMSSHESLPSFLQAYAVRGLTYCAIVMFVLTTPIHFICGWEFHKRAITMLTKGYLMMDLLFFLSTNLAYFYSCGSLVVSMIYARDNPAPHEILHGEVIEYHHLVTIPHYFETSAVLITVLLIGKFVETKVKLKNCRIINRLNKSENHVYTVLNREYEPEYISNESGKLLSKLNLPKSNTINVPAVLLHIGDIIVLESKMIVPADGYVEQCSNLLRINEAILTGETKCIAKSTGDKVYAGSLIEFGSMYMRISEIDNCTFLGQVKQLVETANTKKSHTQVIADKVSQWFVPAILVFSLCTFVIWIIILEKSKFQSNELSAIVAFRFAIAVIAVACPCALGLATPTAVALSTGTASKNGILIRNVDVIQQASERITDVIFDKTGTLTTGSLYLNYIASIRLDEAESTFNNLLTPENSVLQDDAFSMLYDTQLIPMKSLIDKLKNHSVVKIKKEILSNLYYRESIIRQDILLQCDAEPEVTDLFFLWLIASLQQKTPSHVISRSFTEFYAKEIDGILKPCETSNIKLAPVIWHKTSSNGIKGILDCQQWFESECNYMEINKSTPVQIHIGNLTYLEEEFTKEEFKNNSVIKTLIAYDYSNDLITRNLTMTYLAINKAVVSAYGFMDTIRPESFEVLKILKADYNCKFWLCTGDTKKNAFAVANILQIPLDHVKFQAKPEEKVEFVRLVRNNFKMMSTVSTLSKKNKAFFKRLGKCIRHVFTKPYLRSKSEVSSTKEDSMSAKTVISKHTLNVVLDQQKSDCRVVMIGDGINDGPSLADADLGIAMGTKAQLTASAADVILIESNLMNVVSVLRLAKKTGSIIRQNYLWSFLFNTIAIPVAAGIFYPTIMLPPAMAGSLMALSSTFVVLNSLRLTAFKFKVQQSHDNFYNPLYSLV